MNRMNQQIKADADALEKENTKESTIEENSTSEKYDDQEWEMYEAYMDKAISLAEKAYECGDVPIGCIIVKDNKIIARGYNKRNKKKTTLAHAELLAIELASKKLGDWRLEECTMYVTLEPCQMCAGAIVQARIPKVVIGCMNKKAGCAGSVINLLDMPQFNHQVEVVTGVRQQECSNLMSSFFTDLRKGRFSKNNG
jgi:tRNA(adenine34) deaminase